MVASLFPCPSCRRHINPGAPCPFCGHANRRPMQGFGLGGGGHHGGGGGHHGGGGGGHHVGGGHHGGGGGFRFGGGGYNSAFGPWDYGVPSGGFIEKVVVECGPNCTWDGYTCFCPQGQSGFGSYATTYAAWVALPPVTGGILGAGIAAVLGRNVATGTAIGAGLGLFADLIGKAVGLL